MFNHNLHSDLGYKHGLGDSMNVHEQRDFLKLLIGVLLLLTAMIAVVAGLSRCKNRKEQQPVREVEVADEV